MEIFQSLNEKGITILMVTHEPDIAQFARNNIEFKDGRILRHVQVTDRKSASEELEKLPLPIPDEEYT